ncbi:MAG TPA: hypothetical protein VFT32_12805 [Candidatus Eisenbacteria bacterium]|nr:hypothetical protein [Candidatus Eisenbacteria bacterium]
MVRRRYAKFAAAAALSACAWLLAGCAAERSVLVADEELTAATLRDGGVALVGVTMVDEVEQIRPPLVAALERAMAETRPDLALRPAAAVTESLGTAESRRVLAGYQRAAAVDAPTLESLSGTLSATARYALFARVDKSTVHLPPAPRPSDYEYGPPRFTGSIRRDARVRLTLYDLARRRVAWEAVYSSSSENSLPDSLALMRRGQPRATYEAGRPGGSADLAVTPETPSLAEAAMEAFRRFAGDLPR